MPLERVLLVKEPRIPSLPHDDPYHVALSAAGYAVHFLPALAHRWSNIEELHRRIVRGSFKQYAGVIFTSQRAVDAWQEAWKTVDAEPEKLGWNRIPFYTVGPATARLLSSLPAGTVPPSHLILGAEESGNAAKLAEFIASRQPINDNRSLLYLVGDKRKDTLSTLLGAANISVHEVQVYETYPSPTFANDFHEVSSSGSFDWIIFFSPSGAKLLLPLLERMPRFAAIGPTTCGYLQSVPNLTIQAVAESPTPDALVEALVSADHQKATPHPP